EQPGAQSGRRSCQQLAGLVETEECDCPGSKVKEVKLLWAVADNQISSRISDVYPWGLLIPDVSIKQPAVDQLVTGNCVQGLVCSCGLIVSSPFHPCHVEDAQCQDCNRAQRMLDHAGQPRSWGSGDAHVRHDGSSLSVGIKVEIRRFARR